MNTKIYGTIGPACCETDMLVRLFEEGMTGVRINLSHSNLCEVEDWIQNIHTAYRLFKRNGSTDGEHGSDEVANEEMSKTIECENVVNQPELLMDLRGPELRIGKLLTERILQEGDHLSLVPEGRNNLFDPTELPAPNLIFPHLKEGQEILIDDGKILLVTEERFLLQGTDVTMNETKQNEYNYGVECRILRGGVLKSSKSIALKNVIIEPPTLTESDLANIAVAKSYGITGVMLPFVRGKEDLMNLKQALCDAGASDISIFAKIENAEGVKKLPELLPHCNEIVIARGDLGNAMPLWKLPVVQEEIVRICKDMNKPFMIVTQMLASMEYSAVPTRAEVSDIFRAVAQGAASVMLTGETAAGKYPVEAIEYLTNTVCETEMYMAQ